MPLNVMLSTIHIYLHIHVIIDYRLMINKHIYTITSLRLFVNSYLRENQILFVGIFKW